MITVLHQTITAKLHENENAMPYKTADPDLCELSINLSVKGVAVSVFSSKCSAFKHFQKNEIQ